MRVKENFKTKIRKHYKIGLLLLIAGIARLLMVGEIPRWDSAIYYDDLRFACKNFVLWGDYIMKIFSLASHRSLFYALILSIGEFLLPGKGIGPQLVNILMEMLAIWCFYRILRKLFPEVKENILVLETALFSVLPLFFGLSVYIHLDLGVALFFIYLLYGIVCDRKLMVCIAALGLSESKETGALLLGVFGITYIGILFADNNGKFLKKIRKVLCDLKLWAMAPSALAYLYLLLNEQNGGWNDVNAHADVDHYNVFGVEGHYILIKLKSFFVLNFQWIICACLIAGLVILWKQKIRLHWQEKRILILTAAVETTFVLFGLFYITAALSRYNIVSDMALLLMTALLWNAILRNRYSYGPKVCKGMLGIFALLAVEAFVTIDPMTHLAFQKVETGTIDMVYACDETRGIYYGDGMCYNHQYIFLNRAYNKALKECGYDETTVVYSSDKSVAMQIGNEDDRLPCYWDGDRQKRVLEETEETIPIRQVFLPENGDMSALADEELYPERIIVIVLPYQKEENEQVLTSLRKSGYSVTLADEYRGLGGIVPFYLLEKTAYATYEETDAPTDENTDCILDYRITEAEDGSKILTGWSYNIREERKIDIIIETQNGAVYARRFLNSGVNTALDEPETADHTNNFYYRWEKAKDAPRRIRMVDPESGEIYAERVTNTSKAALVRRLNVHFAFLYGRTMDKNEIQEAKKAFEKKGLTDNITRLYNEYYRNHEAISNEDFLQQIYRYLLGRKPTEEEFTDWMKQLKQGKSRSSVLNRVAHSEEAASKEGLQ